MGVARLGLSYGYARHDKLKAYRNQEATMMEIREQDYENVVPFKNDVIQDFAKVSGQPFWF